MNKSIINIIIRSRIKAFAIALPLTIMSCTQADGADNGQADNSQETPSSELIDKSATANTQALYANLRTCADSGVIFGQQEAYLIDNEYGTTCDISDITGEYQLLTGGDIENLTNDDYAEGNWRYTRVQNMIEWIKECHKKGVFVTLSWHFREPFYGDSFYVTDMDAVDPNTSAAAFKSILEGGVNHTYYKKKLALLANFFKSLTDENGELIPIIFRPFHEFNGSWFWWGVPYYATSEEFIQNWQFTVDFLRGDCMVHNLIYAFTPGFDTEEEYLESYPGDDYVDILGFDTYTSNKIATESVRKEELAELVNQFNVASALAEKRGKLAAFTEFGHDLKDSTKSVDNIYTEFYLEALKQMNGKLAYMMTWYNSDEKHFTPLASDSAADKTDFTNFVGSDEILTSGEITSPLIP